MCGRARCTLRADDIPRASGINDGPIRSVQMDSYRPYYNVSPGTYMPVVRREDAGGEGAVLHCMKWGLVPSFTKKTEKPDHFKMFNARSESVNEKASFRRLIPNNRCLVAVEGFYEWKKDGSKKQPYYIHFKDERPLVFAALYDSWKNSEGEVLYTFTILTTSSSSSLQWLHDRMPVILGEKGSTDAWLSGSVPKLGSVLKPYEDPDLMWYPVTPAMGKTSFNGPECIKEIQLKPEVNNSISKFFTKKKIENHEDSAKMSLLENVKDEPGNQEESAKMTLPENVKDECINQEESARMSLLENVKDEPGNQEESAKMSLVENIKDEQANQEDAEDTTDSKVSKTDVSFLVPDEAGKCGIKREYEECAANMKSTINKLETSHAKKKANLKSAGDKQSTLFSYFSKS